MNQNPRTSSPARPVQVAAIEKREEERFTMSLPLGYDRIVAIDFGYSSIKVAWCIPGAPSSSWRVIDNWEGAFSEHEEYSWSIPAKCAYPMPDPAAEPSGEALGIPSKSPPVPRGFEFGFSASNPIGQSEKVVLVGIKAILSNNTKNGTRFQKASLQGKISLLMNGGSIRTELDCLVHLLAAVLRRVRLEPQLGLHDQSRVKYILTIPVMFRDDKLKRIAEDALEEAGFPRFPEDGTYHTYILKEAIAAAMHALSQADDIRTGEGCVVLDIGGLTSDVSWWRVKELDPLRPLRFEREEVVPPKGAAAGMSNVNVAFRELASTRLRGIRFEPTIHTMNEILDKIVHEFEQGIKKTLTCASTYAELGSSAKFDVPGLQRHQGGAEWAHRNCMYMTLNDLRGLFEKTIRDNEKLLGSFFRTIKNKKGRIDRLYLAGGGSDSPLLSSRLKMFAESEIPGIKVVCPDRAMEDGRQATHRRSASVAVGALLWAQDERDGEPEEVQHYLYRLTHVPDHNIRDLPRSKRVRIVRRAPKRGHDGEMYHFDMLERFVSPEGRKSRRIGQPSVLQYSYTSKHCVTVNPKEDNVNDLNYEYSCGEVVFSSNRNLGELIHYDVALERGVVELDRVSWDVAPLMRQIPPTHVRREFDEHHERITHVWDFEFEIKCRIQGHLVRFDLKGRADGAIGDWSEVRNLSATSLYLPGYTGRA